MPMMIKPFLLSFLAVIILDGVWLGIFMRKFYRRELGGLLRTKPTGKLNPRLWSAGIVYVCLAAGITAFVLPEGSLGFGFLFGVIVYGVYEFSNYALLKGWSAKAVAVDVVWGGVLGALVTEFTYRLTA